ncbi:Peptidase, M50 family [Verrucomicrobia bacterium]|nr:Peptidase, M50 family [Verrucomicrobiota bacterium]
MAETFSESWYRVANLRLSLRTGVRVRRQNFRGERWLILENAFSNQYFRLRPAAYEFLARLRPDRTVEQVWHQCLELFPDEAPSQGDAIQLLAQLYFANLLQYDSTADSAQLFQRFKQRQQREMGFRFRNIMFMRFPLLDPDRWLARLQPLSAKIFSPLGAGLWLVVAGVGLKIVLDNFTALREQGQNVLAPGNLFLLYLGLVVVKTLHEFGHATCCRRFGGEVHVMGVMLMIFTPMPYVDTSSSWSFRERWKRVMVGASGMIVEVFVAAIATLVWSRSAPGTLHNLAYNIMFVASVSTIIFNVNPLLRFDGYYILSDLIEIPNLNQRASEQLRHLAESKLFGVKQSASPAGTPREAVWLVVYGVTSGVYRVVVFSGVLLAVADRFLLVGMLMAAACLISWVTVPLVRLVSYLAASPRLDRVRWRAVGVTGGAAAVVLLLLDVVPFPNSFRAPGVVRAVERTQVANETAGQVEAVLTKSGSAVRRGQPLLRLQNRELGLELASAQGHLAETDARLLQARHDETADLKPLAQMRAAAQARVEKLSVDVERLVVSARQDGIWVAPGIEEFAGRWLPRGSDLGLLVDPASFEFAATVMQEDVDALFGQKIPRVEMRLYGDAGTSVPVLKWRVVPGGQRVLPSLALGWRAGGEVPVATDDAQGNRTAEPYFEVLGKLEPNDKVALLDGRSGKIRFQLEAKPLLPRWLRRLWQLFQKRYQI